MNALAFVLAFALAPAPIEKEEGFKPLFNGKDLTGWVIPDNKEIGRAHV